MNWTEWKEKLLKAHEFHAQEQHHIVDALAKLKAASERLASLGHPLEISLRGDSRKLFDEGTTIDPTEVEQRPLDEVAREVDPEGEFVDRNRVAIPTTKGIPTEQLAKPVADNPGDKVVEDTDKGPKVHETKDAPKPFGNKPTTAVTTNKMPTKGK